MKGTDKGMRRKAAKTAGQRKAFDDTMDYKKPASKTTMARKTTTKGNARKTAPMGSRLAYDDTKQEHDKKHHDKKHHDKKKAPSGLAKWRMCVKKANEKLGTKGIPKKGSKAYTMAKKMMND